MPLYLLNTEGKTDFRLISADSRHLAEQHFLGKHNLIGRTISDPAEGAELAAQYKLEKAGEVTADPPKSEPEKKGDDQANGDGTDGGDKGDPPANTDPKIVKGAKQGDGSSGEAS